MLGAHNVESSEETNSVLIGVDKIVVNPEYNFVSKENDLALLQLPRPVDFAANPTIRPVCLPANSSQDYSGRTATVAGWGRQSSGGIASSVLMVDLRCEMTGFLVGGYYIMKLFRDLINMI